jgi:16S rRNA (cytosine1402-N4)-methyltransferase
MAGRIARTISRKRTLAPIQTTTQLAAIVASCMPAQLKRQKIHPATRTFQAIRIAVNNELAIIKPAINDAAEVLKPGGRLCVISFHSLEDRIIKNEFRVLTGICDCPKDIPYCICQKETKLKIITKKAITPQTAEIEANPRARSAKLRVAEKV